jgi:hypothetical protein
MFAGKPLTTETNAIEVYDEKTVKVKVKLPLCHGDVWGSGDIAPHILNLGTRRR